MRILHTVMTFHPDSSAGGPVSNVYAYAQGLLRSGHQVSVCCSDRLDLKRRVEVDAWHRGVSKPVLWDGIQVVYVRSFHPGYGGYGTTLSPMLWLYLNREMLKYDLVHIHGAWNTFGVTTGVVARLRRVPYVIQLHNTFAIRSHRVMLKKLFHTLVRVPWFNHAAAILAFTPNEKEEYLLSRPHDEHKVFVVPGIMPIVRVPEKRRFRQRFGILPHDCLVLYLGRLHRGKGIEHLVRSLRLLGKDNVHLAIVGPDAGNQATLRELAQSLGLADQVLFTGPIYGDEKYSAYGDADVFVLPSMFEQLPVSALEAAMCGMPLILSDRCGMTEMITRAEAGMIVPYGSPQALADAIAALCRDPQQKRRMGRNAAMMVGRYCDPERVITKLEEIYVNVCSRPVRAGVSSLRGKT